MTLRQEAHAMIDSLPNDDSIRFFIEMIRQFNIVTRKTEQTHLRCRLPRLRKDRLFYAWKN